MRGGGNFEYFMNIWLWKVNNSVFRVELGSFELTLLSSHHYFTGTCFFLLQWTLTCMHHFHLCRPVSAIAFGLFSEIIHSPLWNFAELDLFFFFFSCKWNPSAFGFLFQLVSFHANLFMLSGLVRHSNMLMY